MKQSKRLSLAKISTQPRNLLADVRKLILAAREGVARAVDSGLVALYWHVGRRIHKDILAEKRAEYGKRIVPALSAQLTHEFGSGFTARNLFNMVRFAEAFPRCVPSDLCGVLIRFLANQARRRTPQKSEGTQSGKHLCRRAHRGLGSSQHPSCLTNSQAARPRSAREIFFV